MFIGGGGLAFTWRRSLRRQQAFGQGLGYTLTVARAWLDVRAAENRKSVNPQLSATSSSYQRLLGTPARSLRRSTLSLFFASHCLLDSAVVLWLSVGVATVYAFTVPLLVTIGHRDMYPNPNSSHKL